MIELCDTLQDVVHFEEMALLCCYILENGMKDLVESFMMLLESIGEKERIMHISHKRLGIVNIMLQLNV